MAHPISPEAGMTAARSHQHSLIGGSYDRLGRLRRHWPRQELLEHFDFCVVVKCSEPHSASWKWEIYRAGRTSAIEQSDSAFGSITEANDAGKKALKTFLSEFQE